ncbi:MAG: cytochrome c oxidase subunit II transmembrane domain-containing protein [Crocinitomicaceae bacterium]|jgi:cytochrome c oxidase subunit 2|nr:cytochrome c oxidase subunit II transmembrane domain-containing protein [Crocinitomicaceae bacterium]MDG2463910.1 cytochrome c oxidase subunit II transmembrane domain-containing protein [Crocinitomicaceae bacterium]
MGSKLIIIAVLVLGVFAIAQLMRLYEISSKMTKKGETEVNIRDNNMNGKLMLVFMILLTIGFIWLMKKYGWTGRGDAASVHGAEYDWLMGLNLIIIIIGCFITNFLLFYFSFKFVKKPGVKAYWFPHDNKLEMIWTVVPAIILAIIIILGLRSWNEITGPSDNDAIRIELFSKQFDWTARYAGEDNKLGKFDYKLTTDANELALMTTATIDTAIMQMENGLSGIKTIEAKLNDRNVMMVPDDREKMMNELERKQRLIRLLHQIKERHDSKLDAMAYDDIIQKDTLYLCSDQAYEFNFRAKDVIHSAYFPHFRAQMNNVPGQVTRFKFTPNVTTEEMRERMNNPNFNYILMCNKICGGAHYKMKMIVVVLTKAEFNKWLDGKKGSTFKDTFMPPAPAPAPVEGEGAPTEGVVVEEVAVEAA